MAASRAGDALAVTKLDRLATSLHNFLAMVAEFEADLIRARTARSMQVAKAKGRLRGKQPKLSKSRKPIWSPFTGQGRTTAELAELFSMARSTVYRAIKNAGDTIQPLSGHINGDF